MPFLRPKADELVALKVESHGAVDIACSRPEGLRPVPAKPGPGNADHLVGSPDRDLWGAVFTSENRTKQDP